MAKLKYEQVKEYIESYGYKLLSKEYVGCLEKIEIECTENHTYLASFSSFKSGTRCPMCNLLSKRISYEEIKKLVDDSGYKLIDTNIIKEKTHITVECKMGHTYNTSWQTFKRGRRCRICSGSNKKSYEYVYNYILNEGYNLISKEYKDNKQKLNIECPKGHRFDMKFNHFSSGIRCPYCKESKGENMICEYLSKNNISYIRQYRFNDCRHNKPLPFDFYLKDYGVAIEYDGELHFKSVDFFGGDDSYEITKIRDEIKTVYCNHNNIKLIRIPYWELNNIENILEKELNSAKETFND